MNYNGIIITGTSCSGKSSIAKELSKNSKYEVVRAQTTREPRDGDFYYAYLTEDEFRELDKKKKFAVSAEYRGKYYGILNSDILTVIKKKDKTPILIVTPEAAKKLDNDNEYMVFFLDAIDEILEKRYLERQKAQPSIDFSVQNDKDRTYSESVSYIAKPQSILSGAQLINMLWEDRNRSGPLSGDIIRCLIENGMLLENASTSDTAINSASYDLCLGDEYYYGGKIKKLSESNPILPIEPYDYAIVSCKEIANMPRDIIGKFGLSVSLFCQGIILSNGPQIDPGFHGTLFCLLFNTSNKSVNIKRGKHYATIEFNKLIRPAKHPYKGQYQNVEKIIEYIPANALQGAINELKKEIERLKKDNKLMQNIYLGVVGAMFAIISILLIIF